MPCTFEKNAGGIQGLIIITQQKFTDSRGYFREGYKKADLELAGIPLPLQDNDPFTTKGSFRGLHFQKPPKAQGKLVRVVSGAIFDVAVDIRNGSPTFGKWFGLELSADNCKQLYVPEGFAHGFVAIEDSHVVYAMTHNEYSPEADSGILWNDPAIDIAWPVKPSQFSDKDLLLPLLEDIVSPFNFVV